MKHIFSCFVLIFLGISVCAQTNQFANSGIVSLSGKTFGPEQLDGKIVVLNFWFTSCPPCLKEIPELNKLVEEYKGKDVVFLGFASDDKQTLEPFLKENPFHYEIIPSAATLMVKILAQGKSGKFEAAFPTHIVVDREGKRVVYETGLKGIEAVKAELDRQFKGK